MFSHTYSKLFFSFFFPPYMKFSVFYFLPFAACLFCGYSSFQAGSVLFPQILINICKIPCAFLLQAEFLTLIFSLYDRCSDPFIIFMASHCTLVALWSLALGSLKLDIITSDVSNHCWWEWEDHLLQIVGNAHKQGITVFCYEGTLLAHDQLAGHQGPAGPLQGCLPSGWPLYWMEEVVVVVLQLPRVQGEAEHLVVLLIFLRVIFQNKSGHPFSIPKVMHEK